MFMMRNVKDLWNFIAYVLAYAPDRFPHEDFLADNEQMTLDKAFVLLRQGVELAHPGNQHSEWKTVLNGLLDKSLSSYRSGHDEEAGHLLNEFEAKVFKVEQLPGY